jgi:hypothetical protein
MDPWRFRDGSMRFGLIQRGDEFETSKGEPVIISRHGPNRSPGRVMTETSREHVLQRAQSADELMLMKDHRRLSAMIT